MTPGRIASGLAAIAVVAVAVWGFGYAGWGQELGDPDARDVQVPEGRVRVEVLNGGGVSGRAAEATQQLRDSGFDVVLFGNADAFDHDSSAVIDRVGRVDFAAAVANALGIRNVQADPDPNLFVDVTVLLGRDWPGPSGVETGEGDVPTRSPWDPRGWLGR